MAALNQLRMKDLNRFEKYRNGLITIEIQSFMPEKFINILWKNDINIKSIKRVNITTIIFDIKLSDYSVVKELGTKAKMKIRILKRRGISFSVIKLEKRKTLIVGAVIFICLIYYLSTFIWDIQISSSYKLPPYDIRQNLYSMGIKKGVNKNNIDVNEIEEKLQKTDDNVLWVKVRIEGAILKVVAEERKIPPQIVSDETPCNLVASKDAEVMRVYTKAGTSVVKNSDLVKKGQILVKGEQGKENNIYSVHADGTVIGKTFYEESSAVVVKGVNRIRTGNSIENIYITVNNKRINIKNSLNSYKKCDKIEKTDSFIKREIYYEVNEIPYSIDAQKAINNTAEKLYSNIIGKFDKEVKVIDKKLSYESKNDSYVVHLLVIAEENVAVPEKIE